MSDSNGIHRLDLETATSEPIIQVTLRDPGTLTIEPSAGTIYWTDFDEITSLGMIYRANMDGSDVVPLPFEGLNRPHGITIEPVSGKVYWTDKQTSSISRADLDGTNLEAIITDGLSSPQNIVVDTLNGSIFCTDIDAGTVFRANLDGSELEGLVVSSLASPNYIAIDPESRKVYWTDDNASAIRRANYDGSEIENLITSTNIPFGLSLDLEAGMMYWTEMPGFGGPRRIRRASLDGMNEEDVIALNTGFFPQSIAVDPVSEEMYWFDNFNKKIQRAPYNGFMVEDIHIATRNPYGIAIDDIEDKIYWSDQFTHSILRANLDGSEVEQVYDNLIGIAGIDIDSQSGTIYWSQEGNISRGSISGGSTEIIASELGFAFTIDIDVETNSIFWIDEGFATVQKTSLEGGPIEDLLPGLLASDLEMDPDGNTLYLATFDKFQRLDFTTEALEDAFSLEPNRWVSQFTLDADSDKLYWIDHESQNNADSLLIRQANFDGTEATDVAFVKLFRPNDIAVGPSTLSGSSNEDKPSLSKGFELSSTYPNPFRNTTTITYSLTRATDITLHVYDLLGRRVSVLSEGIKQPGEHRETWNASTLPAGVYLVQLSTEDGLRTTRGIVKVE